MELNDFSNEVLIKIFNQVLYEERPAIKKVCKKWNSLIEQDIDLFVAHNNFFYEKCDEINYSHQKTKCVFFKNDKKLKQSLINLFQEFGTRTRKLHFLFDVFSVFKEKEPERKQKRDEKSQAVELISEIFQHFPNLICLKFNVDSVHNLSSHEFTALLQFVAPHLKQLGIVDQILTDKKCAIDLICQHLNPNKFNELTFKTDNNSDIEKMNKRFPWTDLKVCWSGDVKSFQDSPNVRYLKFRKLSDGDLEYLPACSSFLDKLYSFDYYLVNKISFEKLIQLKKFTGLTEIHIDFGFEEVEFICFNFPKLERLRYVIPKSLVDESSIPHPPSFYKLKNLRSLILKESANYSENLRLHKCLPIESVRFFIFMNIFYEENSPKIPTLNQLITNLADIFPNLEVIQLVVPLFHPELLISGLKRLTKIRKVLLNIFFTNNLFYPSSLAEFCMEKNIEFHYCNSYVFSEEDDGF